MSTYALNVLFNAVRDNPTFEGYILRDADITTAKTLANAIRKQIPDAKVRRSKGYVYVSRKGEGA